MTLEAAREALQAISPNLGLYQRKSGKVDLIFDGGIVGTGTLDDLPEVIAALAEDF